MILIWLNDFLYTTGESVCSYEISKISQSSGTVLGVLVLLLGEYVIRVYYESQETMNTVNLDFFPLCNRMTQFVAEFIAMVSTCILYAIIF